MQCVKIGNTTGKVSLYAQAKDNGQKKEFFYVFVEKTQIFGTLHLIGYFLRCILQMHQKVIDLFEQEGRKISRNKFE